MLIDAQDEAGAEAAADKSAEVAPASHPTTPIFPEDDSFTMSDLAVRPELIHGRLMKSPLGSGHQNPAVRSLRTQQVFDGTSMNSGTEPGGALFAARQAMAVAPRAPSAEELQAEWRRSVENRLERIEAALCLPQADELSLPQPEDVPLFIKLRSQDPNR